MPQQRTKVSIVIPTHNRAMLTARAVDSVLANRSCGRVEVLVVDDGSNDGSADTLRARYAGAAGVRVLSLPVNRGPSAARNLGIEHASGQFLLFLDSDDTLLPEALAFALAAFHRAPEMRFLALEGSALNVVSGAWLEGIQHKCNPGWSRLGDWARITMQVHARDGRKLPPATLRVGDLAEAILFDDLFFLSGTLVRQEAARAAGPFNERFRFLEDWDFMARVCQTGPGGYLDHCGFHREHGRSDQLSTATSVWLRAAMHQRVLDGIRATPNRDAARFRRPVRRAQAAADYLLGRALLQQRCYHQARSRFARALGHGYKPPKSLVWLVGSQVAPEFARDRLEEHNPLLQKAATYFAEERK